MADTDRERAEAAAQRAEEAAKRAEEAEKRANEAEQRRERADEQFAVPSPDSGPLFDIDTGGEGQRGGSTD